MGAACCLGLLTPVALPERTPAQGAAAAEDFGRWETHLHHCRMAVDVEANQAGAMRGCQLMRLDQQMQGLLSVRFLDTTSGSRNASGQMVYAGVLDSGSPTMRCRQGRCEPRWPMRLLVSAVANSGFDRRGLALGIPQARMARGQCLLQKRTVRCQASETEGARWETSGRW